MQTLYTPRFHYFLKWSGGIITAYPQDAPSSFTALLPGTENEASFPNSFCPDLSRNYFFLTYHMFNFQYLMVRGIQVGNTLQATLGQQLSVTNMDVVINKASKFK